MIKLLSILSTFFIFQNVFSQTICKRLVSNFNFPDAGYAVAGTAILTDSLGSLYLTFSSDFSTSPGPDLYVYLTETGEAPTAPGNDDYEIALLSSPSGAQTYTLPSSVSLNDYDYVTIHCKQYNHLWNSGLMATPSCFTYPTYSNVTLEECFSYTSPSGNNIWTNTGIYIDTLEGMNSGGGDSIITIDLTINEVEANVMASSTSNMLMAEANQSTYQWINCSDFSILEGEINQNFNPTQNGEYAVIVTSEDNCIDTSSCFIIQSIGISESEIESYFLYPNPSSGILNIQTNSIIQESLRIYSILGQPIQYETLSFEENKIQIEPKTGVGVYILHLVNKQGEFLQKKFVIN